MNLSGHPCLRCNGRGTDWDHGATGAEFRAWREAQGVSIYLLDQKGFTSRVHLSELERGLRSWNERTLNRLIAAVEKLSH
jgi:transcriptional regulator with XRE-family HTH domain